jgi:hypothetical protein
MSTTEGKKRAVTAVVYPILVDDDGDGVNNYKEEIEYTQYSDDFEDL